MKDNVLNGEARQRFMASCIAAAATATMLQAGTASAAPVYSATIVSIPGTVLHDVVDLSDTGHVVGYTDIAPGVARAFRWSPTSTTLYLPPRGDTASLGFAMSNSGAVAGTTIPDGGGGFGTIERPGVWTPTGAFAELGRQTSRGTAYSGVPVAISESGAILGNLRYGGPLFTSRATVWVSGVPLDLGAPVGQVATEAQDINESGHVVLTSGSQGYLWEAGLFTSLGFASALSINDSNQISGTVSYLSAGRVLSKAGRWQSGSWTLLDSPENSESDAWDMNAGGDVVGAFVDRFGVRRGLLWEGTTVYDLNDRLLPSAQAALGVVSSARAINASGQILVVGEKGWAVLTPSDLPPSLVAAPSPASLIAVAMFALAISSIRRRNSSMHS